MILLYSSRKQIYFYEIRHFWKKQKQKHSAACKRELRRLLSRSAVKDKSDI